MSHHYDKPREEWTPQEWREAALIALVFAILFGLYCLGRWVGIIPA
jgi:hypothetical protein